MSLRDLALKTVQGSKMRVLDPTELVHELYIKLAKSRGAGIPRTEFLALAASVLRSVLVDRARGLATLKRGGPFRHLTLHGVDVAQRDEVDVLVFEEALGRLADLDERMARVVELRFYGGLENEEIAETLSVSARTVDKEWAMAKAWLHRELG